MEQRVSVTQRPVHSRSVFSELLGSITERSLKLIDPGRGRDVPASADRVIDLCHRLMSSKGEATGLALAWRILTEYADLPAPEKASFFRCLLVDFGADAAALATAAKAYVADPCDANAVALNVASEPRRQELVRRLNQTRDGTRRLVAMRADLLRAVAEDRDLNLVDMDFAHLLYSWFNRGFLELHRIDWDTSAAVLEKIIQYEAVHEISDWDDLRRRIDLPDRRLYGFFHPRLADDPLIFVEVALTVEPPASIQNILSPERQEIAANDAKTAVFYSISNCQTGLRGVSFGSFLIKQVVETLTQEFPGLRHFVTLSPIPGFSTWLKRQDDWPSMEPALAWQNDAVEWVATVGRDRALQHALLARAAHYLTLEKDGMGRPIDGVARFHLGNGAILDRINWLANVNPAGIEQSWSLMVNYRYKLDEIEKNHEAFANAGTIAASSAVSKLAKTPIRGLPGGGTSP